MIIINPHGINLSPLRPLLPGIPRERNLRAAPAMIAASGGHLALEVARQAQREYPGSPVVVAIRGAALRTAEAVERGFSMDAQGAQVAFAYRNMDTSQAFVALEDLVAFMGKERDLAEAQRTATAGRWSDRAEDWQGIIDDAGSYVNHEDGYARFNAMLGRIMQTVEKPLCLDVGCGNGDVARQMERAGAASVTGIDDSPGMIAAARQKDPGSHILYERSQLSDCRASGREYDVIASRGVVLSHIPKREVYAHLLEMSLLARGGAYAVFDFIQKLENGGFPNAGEKTELTVEWLRATMRGFGWVPVAQDGDEKSRVVIVAFHRPFPDSVYFVTSNPMKIREMRAAAKHEHLHGCDFDLPELKHDSIERIAEDKARQAYAIVGRPVVCTDGGIFMNAYDGFPGPNSKQAATKLKPEGLIRLLDGVEDRSGLRRNAAAFFDGKKMSVETSEIAVRFSKEVRGTYPSYPMDKVLIPCADANPDGLTYAEMPPEERGRVSELGALAEFVQSIAVPA